MSATFFCLKELQEPDRAREAGISPDARVRCAKRHVSQNETSWRRSCAKIGSTSAPTALHRHSMDRWRNTTAPTANGGVAERCGRERRRDARAQVDDGLPPAFGRCDR